MLYKPKGNVKYPGGRYQDKNQADCIRNKIVCYPSDHRVVEEKKIIKFFRTWLF